jgi:hypothetical protein
MAGAVIAVVQFVAARIGDPLDEAITVAVEDDLRPGGMHSAQDPTGTVANEGEGIAYRVAHRLEAALCIEVENPPVLDGEFPTICIADERSVLRAIIAGGQLDGAIQRLSSQ